MGQLPTSSKPNLPQELKLFGSMQEGLYFNTTNNKFYEKKDIFMHEAGEITYQQDIYTFRRVNQNYLTPADYLISTMMPSSCSNSYMFTFFVQKHQKTLFDIKTIPKKQGLQLLRNVLIGFAILYDKFGYFQPTSKMIFFFGNGNQPKTWINQDTGVTRNIQNPNQPKNQVLQNKFIHEIFHLFDVIRDQKRLIYSNLLPQFLLNFEQVNQIIFKHLCGQCNIPKIIITNNQNSFLPHINNVKNGNNIQKVENINSNILRINNRPFTFCGEKPSQEPLTFKNFIYGLQNINFSQLGTRKADQIVQNSLQNRLNKLENSRIQIHLDAQSSQHTLTNHSSSVGTQKQLVLKPSVKFQISYSQQYSSSDKLSLQKQDFISKRYETCNNFRKATKMFQSDVNLLLTNQKGFRTIKSIELSESSILNKSKQLSQMSSVLKNTPR